MVIQLIEIPFTVPSWTPCMQIYVHLIQMRYSHDVYAGHVSISPCPHQQGGCNDGMHLAVPILKLSLKSAVQESRMHCKNVLKLKSSKSTVNFTLLTSAPWKYELKTNTVDPLMNGLLMYWFWKQWTKYVGSKMGISKISGPDCWSVKWLLRGGHGRGHGHTHTHTQRLCWPSCGGYYMYAYVFFIQYWFIVLVTLQVLYIYIYIYIYI